MWANELNQNAFGKLFESIVPRIFNRQLLHPALITAAVGLMVGRILLVDHSYTSSNDRSRWATVRALVHQGTYAIGKRAYEPGIRNYKDTGIVFEHGWTTIDKVLQPQTQLFFSSKPPFLSTIVAGEYWLLHMATGLSITTDRNWVIRIILLTSNAIPLTFFLLVLAAMLRRLGASDWCRSFIILSACFGTFLTSFAVVLNNHVAAACCAIFALYTGEKAMSLTTGKPIWFLLTGFLASVTACFEMPATVFLLTMGATLGYRSVKQVLLFYIPAAFLPVFMFLLTNVLAISQLIPAYGELGGPWYEYEGSYWAGGGIGIDSAGHYESRLEYSLNMLLGHHGIFSLSPIFLLSLTGLCMTFQKHKAQKLAATINPTLTDFDISWEMTLALMTAVVTTVVLFFYIQRTTNYGGQTSGPRWFFWLTPFFLLTMVPALHYLGRLSKGRALAYLLLAISIFSAGYRLNKPWSHPWLYDIMHSFKLIDYGS